MKVIKSSYEILEEQDPIKAIEAAGRTCYKSEDKILDQAESAKTLIKNLIDKGHEAMLEHSIL